jgi:hypothetical protein
VVGELVARVSGFGPLQAFLDAPTVEEVWINDPSRVFIARNGRHELTNLMLTTAQVQELVERMLKSSGRRIDVSQPFVDPMRPEGHRLHVVLEGISRGFSAVNSARNLGRGRRSGWAHGLFLRSGAYVEAHGARMHASPTCTTSTTSESRSCAGSRTSTAESRAAEVLRSACGTALAPLAVNAEDALNRSHDTRRRR